MQRIKQIPDDLSAFGIYCPIFNCDTYSIHETTTKSFDNDTVTQLELAGNDLADLAGYVWWSDMKIRWGSLQSSISLIRVKLPKRKIGNDDLRAQGSYVKRHAVHAVSQ